MQAARRMPYRGDTSTNILCVVAAFELIAATTGRFRPTFSSNLDISAWRSDLTHMSFHSTIKAMAWHGAATATMLRERSSIMNWY